MPDEGRRLIVLLVGDIECAIDVARVQEVLPFRPAPADLPVPDAADGMALARDTALAFVDLRSRLGLASDEPRPRARVLRLRDDAPTGLLVDAVRDVLDVASDRVGPAPAWLRRHGMSHVEEVAELDDGRLLLVLRPESLASAPPPHAERSATR